ncbi:Ldh family oxidoreductase [Ralstonia pseudosolanacearum]|uniref:Ldh family oxidoreductase n=1 Tax=Ralstonia pseudosolanacearum TaxID=1310165 RepID=UPI0026773B92|nr:Ldh family oxidoreductase [Ralstonia pseudosolanacearum]MDO3606397.1 Ldh family oxidoreductase [Ralstonia pseudosolanacearum]MDO3612005.1 Ldh family oxidoreductase [Ralstonia pseudosolanacearum]
MPHTVQAEQLTQFGTAVLESLGVPSADAHLLADSLVVAELWGHSSHGMLRLPWYVDRLRSGVMTSVSKPEIVMDGGAITVMDGHHGIGQVLTAKAVDLGIQRAREHGISAVGVRNSNHFGTAAYFTRMAAKEGCVALLATNASPAMAPWGGRAKSIGTNPWSIAAPGGRRGVAVMDIANTAVARGKIYLAAERGVDIPNTWAADENGVPTTNAKDAIHGLILPMAGHKGYVISFMMDVLAGVLTGSHFGSNVAGPYEAKKTSGCGHLLITIDVKSMMPLAEFEQRMEVLIDEVKAVPTAHGIDEIFFPGELEDRNTTRLLDTGISLADTTWGSLAKLGTETGTALPELLPA